MHLDRGYDSGKARDLLEILGDRAEIAVKGRPAGDPGRQALADRADPRVDEWLRQAATLHRQAQYESSSTSLPRSPSSAA